MPRRLKPRLVLRKAATHLRWVPGRGLEIQAAKAAIALL
jgi:hypothetical protein